MLGLRVRFLHEFGAYTAYALNLPQNTLIHSVGPYRIPNLDLALRGVFTNTTPVAAYRGAGRPQGTFVIERALDALARELGLDPIEVRRRNLLQPHELPHDTGLRTVGRGHVVYDSGDYPRCLDVALRALDLPAIRTEQARLRKEGRYLGVGVVNYVEATGTPALESATVRVTPDGRAVVVTGAAPQGQGHVTVLSRVVGEVLGIDPDTARRKLLAMSDGTIEPADGDEVKRDDSALRGVRGLRRCGQRPRRAIHFMRPRRRRNAVVEEE